MHSSLIPIQKLLEHSDVPRKNVLKFSELKILFQKGKLDKSLPEDASIRQLFKEFLAQGEFIEVPISVGVRQEKRYARITLSPYEFALLLRPDSYFSHETALFLNGLVDIEPPTIYVNAEQTPKPPNDRELEQSRIDFAFRLKPRISRSLATFNNRHITLLSGKNTGQLGVIRIKFSGINVHCTNIQRTLIDSAVRPFYSGGVDQVLGAFKTAGSKVSVKRILSMLKSLDYTYPYHQAVGFYLETSGFFTPKQLAPLQELGMEFDFYLCHSIKDKQYSANWRLYYPADLV
ncbi:MAG: hypothetical protein Q8P51_19530 [Ignavibacteria bacterium]|nr:hypothetical protein [Ignavibacteria bacterium]